jgi:hypothetical protein
MEKIELEIVLDDGSVRKAFATIRKEAETTEKEVSASLGSLANPIKAMGFNAYIDLARTALDATASLARGMRDMMLEAEKVRVVNAQFAAITQQTGIATQAFNDAIMASIDGLMDDEDALDLANQAMIRLGLTAQRLPQIFELARKASAAGFGDMKANTEAFIYAIQTGNERALKQQVGLVVDLSAEQKKFAQSLGLTVNQLTEQQRAFVNANAILSEAELRFGKVDGSIKKFSDSTTRLSVNLANLKEIGAVAFESVFGGLIQSYIDRFNQSASLTINQTKEISTSQERAAESAAILRERIALLNKEIMSPDLAAGTEMGADDRMANLTVQLQAAEAALSNLELKFSATTRSIESDPLAKRISLYQEEAAARAKSNEQRLQEMDLSEQRAIQFNQAMLGFSQQENANRQANLEFISTQNQRQTELETLYQDQLRQIIEKGINDRRQIEINFSNERGFSQEQRNQLELAQIEAQNQAILNAQNNFEMNYAGSWGRLQQKAKAYMADIGNNVKATLVVGITQSFNAMGAALARGENAMEAFGKSMLGVLGDIAMQMGQSFILQGIAYSVNPMTPGVGGPLIAAGVALSIFGGFLKALSGGGGGSQAMAGGGGVGAGSSTTPEAPAFDATAMVGEGATRAPQTVVNFQVMGDILDSSDTQNRIVALLNDAIDSKGAVVRGMA